MSDDKWSNRNDEGGRRSWLPLVVASIAAWALVAFIVWLIKNGVH
jgi:hypothetical protein